MMKTRSILILIALLVFAFSAVWIANADATRPPSLFSPIYQTGMGWAEDEYTTDIAFGDVDGDGRDETVIARRTTTGPRILLIDDASADFSLLWTFGEGWGVLGWPTAVAFGDVDGDGRDELAVARATGINERIWVFDDTTTGFDTLARFGREWPPAVYAVGVAFGDVDGDGRDELGVVNNAVEGVRVEVFDDALSVTRSAALESGFASLWSTGETWGAPATATAIAFGDSDGDGADEVAITRNHDINARFFVHKSAPDFDLLWQSGEMWGPGSYATDVAFGNVDDDPAEELGITRKASLNERVYLFDDASTDFATLRLFGQTWAFNAYATSIAFGDVDSDGREEIGLARVATVNERFAVFDDAMPDGGRPPFAELWGGGDEWPGDQYATTIAFGHVDATPEAELGVGRLAGEGPRLFLLARGWITWMPYASGVEGVETPTPEAPAYDNP